jgi:hypothetical protein
MLNFLIIFNSYYIYNCMRSFCIVAFPDSGVDAEEVIKWYQIFKG